MDDPTIQALLKDLQDSDEEIRRQATNKLWSLWFRQKGVYGLDLINRSQIYLEQGDIHQAETLLTELINDQPDFAEAWNRRAVLYYTQERYQDALKDCQAAVKLNPVHFGAWHGLGVCYAALGDYRQAIQAFRKALDIQPYFIINQRLLLECTARLS